jgi:DNA-directed RNA polymerase subunit K/omega
MSNRVTLVMNTPQGANKYEMAIVAAREARRLNNQLRLSGETETSSAKVTTLALARALHKEVTWQYVMGREQAPETTPLPPAE